MARAVARARAHPFRSARLPRRRGIGQIRRGRCAVDRVLQWDHIGARGSLWCQGLSVTLGSVQPVSRNFLPHVLLAFSTHVAAIGAPCLAQASRSHCDAKTQWTKESGAEAAQEETCSRHRGGQARELPADPRHARPFERALWWARVWRENGKFRWRIRTPPQLSQNPIYRLAGARRKRAGSGRTNRRPTTSGRRRRPRQALSEGASGYQQEFRIVGTDGVHWLSEEVIIRPAAKDEWNLAGVLIDVTKRHEAEEARRSTEGQLDQILKGADCLLWQAIVTGDPDTQAPAGRCSSRPPFSTRGSSARTPSRNWTGCGRSR